MICYIQYKSFPCPHIDPLQETTHNVQVSNAFPNSHVCQHSPVSVPRQKRAVLHALNGFVRLRAAEAFLRDLPHGYYEEDNLHAYLLERIRGFEDCAAAVDALLPCVDNWATCDTMNPRALGREPDALLVWIRRWLDSGRLYTMRFGVGMLMRHFLGDRFSPDYPALVAGLRSEQYYVNMMVAWYFATALAKQYDAALPYLAEKRLPPWVQNKTIQKAVESYRISAEQKEELKLFKR